MSTSLSLYSNRRQVNHYHRRRKLVNRRKKVFLQRSKVRNVTMRRRGKSERIARILASRFSNTIDCPIECSEDEETDNIVPKMLKETRDCAKPMDDAKDLDVHVKKDDGVDHGKTVHGICERKPGKKREQLCEAGVINRKGSTGDSQQRLKSLNGWQRAKRLSMKKGKRQKMKPVSVSFADVPEASRKKGDIGMSFGSSLDDKDEKAEENKVAEDDDKDNVVSVMFNLKKRKNKKSPRKLKKK
ncbi:hypothetical protein HanIR_Chr16g0832191 [Helianthus annuus]|nr:hypothetical protein HanIR_Chr16g0832191 [Helianthus annuus]